MKLFKLPAPYLCFPKLSCRFTQLIVCHTRQIWGFYVHCGSPSLTLDRILNMLVTDYIICYFETNLDVLVNVSHSQSVYVQEVISDKVSLNDSKASTIIKTQDIKSDVHKYCFSIIAHTARYNKHRALWVTGQYVKQAQI